MYINNEMGNILKQKEEAKYNIPDRMEGKVGRFFG
jgi:hypothetical protein